MRVLDYIVAGSFVALALVTWVMCAIAVTKSEPAGEIAMVAIAGVMFVIYGALLVWVGKSLTAGKPEAWRFQMALAVIGLMGIPIGTVLNGVILLYWCKPETKAWFGL